MWNESVWQRLMVVLAGIATFLAGIFAVSVAERNPGTYIRWLDGGLYVTVILLAGVVVVIRALRGGPQGLGWSMLGAGAILYAMGEAWWAIDGHSREESLPLPPEDILWLAYYPIQVIALWFFMGKTPRGHRNLHDALVFSGGGIVVLAILIQWWLSLSARPDPEGSLLIDGLYVTGDLVLMVLSLMLVYVHRLRVPRGWWLIVLSFFAFIPGRYPLLGRDGSRRLRRRLLAGYRLADQCSRPGPGGDPWPGDAETRPSPIPPRHVARIPGGDCLRAGPWLGSRRPLW